MPFCRFSGLVSASTTKTSPTVPWVMNILLPFRIQELPLRTAVLRSAAASDPLPGSVRPQAASFFPAAMSGMYLRRNSSLPKRSRWEVPRPLCEATVSARDPSKRAISSTTMAIETASRADPPSSSGTAIPRRPSSPSSETTSRGNRSSRSHSCACGLTSRRQKSRTIATSFRWLSVGSKFIKKRSGLPDGKTGSYTRGPCGCEGIARTSPQRTAPPITRQRMATSGRNSSR